MAGGGSEGSSGPWGPAQGYLESLLAQAGAIGGSGINYDKEYTGLTDAQKDALQQWQGYYSPGGAYEGVYGQTKDRLDQMMNAPDNVFTNPNVLGMIESGTQNIQTQLSEEFLPQIRAGAVGAGQSGSTRQGVAEGVAQGKASEASSDLATQIYGDAAGRASQEAQFAANMMPMLEGMGTSSAKNLFDIQEILRKDTEGKLETDWWNKTQSPWQGLNQWANILYPGAGLGGITTQNPTGGGFLSGAAGGAMAGMSTGNPWLGLAGGVLGGLGSM